MSFNNRTAQPRNNPFSRTGSISAAPASGGRPKSALFSSPSPLTAASTPPSHGRAQSNSSLNTAIAPSNGNTRHFRNDSRSGTPTSNTFAPSFIKAEDTRRAGHDAVKGIEGENDFSGKRYVWLKDPQNAFVKGWVVEELGGNRMLVQCDDGTVSDRLDDVHITEG